MVFHTVSDAQTIPETIRHTTPPVPAADALACTPIERGDVVGLRPPAELLARIAGLAVAIDALLQANLVDHARPVASELRTMIEAARGAGGIIKHVAATQLQ